LLLQHCSPIGHPLPLLNPLLNPLVSLLLYMAWFHSQSSVKLRNPSIIGR
jgi:hypothetical protein